MEPAQLHSFLDALGNTESNNDPNAPLGDGGRAAGRYQIHPDWLQTWATHYHLTPALSEPWDDYFTRVVAAFYRDHTAAGMSDVHIAMYFHLGHPSIESSTDWDTEYAKRFNGFKENGNANAN